MQYVLLAMFFSVIMLGVGQKISVVSSSFKPSAYQAAASTGAQSFTAYRDAVFQYSISNPTYIGEVPDVSLTLTPALDPAVVATFSNYIVKTASGNGRIVYCFTTYSPRLLNELMARTENDASWGSSSGGYWNSAAVGVVAAPVALPSQVPDNMTVSAIQIGV